VAAGNDQEGPGNAGEQADCRERYSRVYDVRRHLASEHEVILTDMEVRILLAKDMRGGVVDT